MYLLPILNDFRDIYNGSKISGGPGQGRIHTRKRKSPTLVYKCVYNITQDTFTLHDRPRDPFTFLHMYTHTHTHKLPVRDCNARLSHSTGLSPVGIPFTLTAFHRHGIGKLFHASIKTPFLTCHYNADTVTIEV